jgi:hypothetical protein
MSWLITGRAVAAPLLDLYPGAAAAYSLRQLTTGDQRNVVRVRRSSDNTEQDFTAPQVTDGTLTTFCGAGNGFVRTWYDQSGNGKNAEQTTTANQPQIVSSGSLVTLNSKPAISFDGSDDFIAVAASTSFNFLHNGTSSTVVSVNRYFNTSDPNVSSVLLSTRDVSNNVSVGSVFLGLDDRSSVPVNNAAFAVIDNASNFAGSCVSRPSDSLVPNTQALRFTLLDADNATASLRCQEHINGGAAIGNNAATGAPSTASITARLFIGAGGTVDGTSFSPSINTTQEVIIYATSQSVNRTAIESNINTHYAIY